MEAAMEVQPIWRHLHHHHSASIFFPFFFIKQRYTHQRHADRPFFFIIYSTQKFLTIFVDSKKKRKTTEICIG